MLAPVLFKHFFSCVLTHVVRDFDYGVYVRYSLVETLFSLRCLGAKTKTLERMILEALFADEYVLMVHKESDLQLNVDESVEVSHLHGLIISLGKTEVLLHPAPGSTAPPSSISIEGTTLKTVEEFRFPGSIISSNSLLEKRLVQGVTNQSSPWMPAYISTDSA